MSQETRAFRDEEEDYTGEEKQKIVLKSLLLLAYCREKAEEIRKKVPGAYHKPLLLTLVNSVNTEDADLELFFREVERIAKGGVSAVVWKEAQAELWRS